MVQQSIIKKELYNGSIYLYKTNKNIDLSIPNQYIYVFLKNELVHKKKLYNKNVICTKLNNNTDLGDYTIIIETQTLSNIEISIEWLSFYEINLCGYDVYFLNGNELNSIKDKKLDKSYLIIDNFSFTDEKITEFRKLELDKYKYFLYSKEFNFEALMNVIEIVKKQIVGVDDITILKGGKENKYKINKINKEIFDLHYKNGEIKNKTLCCLASYPKRREMLLETLDTLQMNNFDSLNIYMNSYNLEDAKNVKDTYKNSVVILDSLGTVRAAGKFFWCNNIDNDIFICDDDINYPQDYKKVGLENINRDKTGIYSCLGIRFKDTITIYPSTNERVLNIKFNESSERLCRVNMIGTGVCFFRNILGGFPEFNELLKYVSYNDDVVALWCKDRRSLYSIKKESNWLTSNVKMEIGLNEEKSIDPILMKVLKLYQEKNPWKIQ